MSREAGSSIEFNIDGGGNPASIRVTKRLQLAGNTAIDGFTQDCGLRPCIELDGSSAPPGEHGLRIAGRSNFVSGLVINRFPGHGIYIRDGRATYMEGNWIGTDITGNKAAPNGGDGIHITNSPGNQIGSRDEIDSHLRNVISGNKGHGVSIVFAESQRNKIEGNLIGLRADAFGELGNSGDGVSVRTAAMANWIGPINIISGNKGSGVIVQGRDVSATEIVGNIITGNGSNGVEVLSAQTTVIGGESGNFISGNGENGIFVGGKDAKSTLIASNEIGVDGLGMTANPNKGHGVVVSDAPSTVIGGTEGGNLISGNDGDGVLILGGSASNTIIQGNRIGLNEDNSGVIPNLGKGITVRRGTRGLVIGSAEPNLGNLISGNVNGIEIIGEDVVDTLVVGNHIGELPDGKGHPGNSDYGLLIRRGGKVKIGGVEKGQGNTFVANGEGGVLISGTAASGSTIQGNRFFFNEGDEDSAVLTVMGGATDVIIGGGEPRSGNLIYANFIGGIKISGPSTTRTVVSGNFIGLEEFGLKAPGNSGHGIAILNSPKNIIGGGDPIIEDAEDTRYGGTCNLISGNDGEGILIAGEDARENLIIGNVIGLDVDQKQKFGNVNHGIAIINASANEIGQRFFQTGKPSQDRYNTISSNFGGGILIQGEKAVANRVLSPNPPKDGVRTAEGGG